MRFFTRQFRGAFFTIIDYISFPLQTSVYYYACYKYFWLRKTLLLGGLYADLEQVIDNSRWLGSNTSPVSVIFVLGDSDNIAPISALADAFDKVRILASY